MSLVAFSIVLAFLNRLQPARIITTLAAFLVLTFFLIEGDGVHDASITAYAGAVTLAGLLLGEMGVVIFGALTTLSLAGLAYAEYLGMFSNKYAGLFDFADVTTIWFLHLATSAIIYFLVRRLSRLAKDAQKGEQEVARTNEELSALRDILQERVDQRTESLVAQNTNLQTASHIASEILSETNIKGLLEKATELISSEFSHEHVAFFLLNEKKDHAVLQTASSESGRKMLADHYRIPVSEESFVGVVASEKRARIALNEGSDSKFFQNSYIEQMRSGAAFPLLTQNEVLGVLEIQAEQANTFTQDNLTIYQSLANQIALAIQNIRLIEDARVTLAQLELIVSEQSAASWRKQLGQKPYGFVYTPVGVIPIRAKNTAVEVRADTEKTEIPITLRGRKIGKISLQRLSSHWTNKEKALLSDVATQVGLAIENARLLNETREQANQEQLVSEVSSRLRETLDMDTVLKSAIDEIKKTFDLKEVEVRLVSPNDDDVN